MMQVELCARFAGAHQLNSSIQIGSRRLIPGDALDRYIDDRLGTAQVMAAQRRGSGN